MQDRNRNKEQSRSCKARYQNLNATHHLDLFAARAAAINGASVLSGYQVRYVSEQVMAEQVATYLCLFKERMR
jgi:hypothetical protein